MVGSRGEAKTSDRVPQERLHRGAQGTMSADVPRSHPGIGVKSRAVAEPLTLHLARPLHPGTDRGARLLRRSEASSR